MPEIISRKEARARGLKRYFTGKPCKHGHICERYTSPQPRCVDCQRFRNKQKYGQNPGYWAEWHRRNRDYATEKSRLRRNDPEIGAKLRAKKSERERRGRLALKVLEELGIEI